MAATLAARLASVQAAIAEIEGNAQGITMEGRTYTRADLATLYRQEEKLEEKIARADSTTRTVAEF